MKNSKFEIFSFPSESNKCKLESPGVTKALFIFSFSKTLKIKSEAFIILSFCFVRRMIKLSFSVNLFKYKLINSKSIVSAGR